MFASRPWILVISFSSALLGLAPRAQAAEAPRGDLEVAAGAGLPLGSDSYSDRFGTGLGLGLRGVYWLGGESWHAGLELSGQYGRSPYSIDLGPPFPSIELDTERFRGLLGVRVEVPLSPRFALTGRFLGGVEHFRTEEVEVYVGGGLPSPTQRFTDTAPALELGVGAQLVVGALRLGAELALPCAYYSVDASHHTVNLGDTTVQMQDDLVTETTVDLDLLLTAGVRF
jgi:hypothetical protein